MKSKAIKIFISGLIFLTVLNNIPAFGQDATGKTSVEINKTNEGDELHKDVMRYTMLIGVYPVTFLIGVKAWEWGDNENFRFGSEHWFGKNADLGGADKAGHIYAHYIVQRMGYSVFDYTENGRSTKWLYSMMTTFAMGLLIEVGDGWSSKYGFAYEDLIADISGLLFGALLDYVPVMDAFFGMSVEYMPTRGFIDRRKSVLDFENDYSGWRYMMNIKMAGFKYLSKSTPEFFRYVQFDLGFFTSGYSPHYDKFTADYANPKRGWYMGISINLSEVVSDFYSDKRSRLSRFSRTPFEYYHVPAGYRKDYTIR